MKSLGIKTRREGSDILGRYTTRPELGIHYTYHSTFGHRSLVFCKTKNVRIQFEVDYFGV